MKPRCYQRCYQMGHLGLKAEWLPGAKALLASGNAGAPGGIRTPNLLIRSQMLYPLSHGCWTADAHASRLRPVSLARIPPGVASRLVNAQRLWISVG